MPSPHYIPEGQSREELVKVMEDNFDDSHIVSMVKCMDTVMLKDFINELARFHGIDLVDGPV